MMKTLLILNNELSTQILIGLEIYYRFVQKKILLRYMILENKKT